MFKQKYTLPITNVKKKFIAIYYLFKTNIN